MYIQLKVSQLFKMLFIWSLRIKFVSPTVRQSSKSNLARNFPERWNFVLWSQTFWVDAILKRENFHMRNWSLPHTSCYWKNFNMHENSLYFFFSLSSFDELWPKIFLWKNLRTTWIFLRKKTALFPELPNFNNFVPWMKIYKENNSQDARFQSRIISKQFQIKVDYERNCNKVIGGKLQNGMTETEIAKQEAIRHILFYIVQMYEVQMLGQEIIHKSFPHRLVFVKRRHSRASLVTKRWKLIFYCQKWCKENARNLSPSSLLGLSFF